MTIIPWCVDEYTPGRIWIRRDLPDGSTETLCQDVATLEQAYAIVRAMNCHDDLLAACKLLLDDVLGRDEVDSGIDRDENDDLGVAEARAVITRAEAIRPAPPAPSTSDAPSPASQDR
jgi:hypothetical protein